ncbi:TlyA family RNA methyltransferase [Helicobacter macacae]|uniref:RNA-binding S4 domain-containing protein n=1 Tax=Helicobacter macacae MIT 99-5501 TaxID=1357400 RepID=V8CA06_9HELI|nr:TlyA family RNA methyltransferase [Helicobacter macacae]ETD23556.1 hypothetical protein HMPREF2086_01361 [Helicobacter macacae MIT 99-5501]
MRLDIALVKGGVFDSRQKASEAIKAGFVRLDNSTITKPAFIVDKDLDLSSHLVVAKDSAYVSRAAFKLKGFLEDLGVDRDFGAGKIAVDIGASRGGFSQILLEFGFSRVVCVDVGSNQLHSKLKSHPRIEAFENCDVREFAKRYEVKYNDGQCDESHKQCTKQESKRQSLDFEANEATQRNLTPPIQPKSAPQPQPAPTSLSLPTLLTQTKSTKPFDLLVCDVSFIGLGKIFDSLEVLSDEMILLYKPQFEVGTQAKRNKKGVLKEQNLIEENLAGFREMLIQRGFCIRHSAKSHIKGKQGNAEFFVHIQR